MVPDELFKNIILKLRNGQPISSEMSDVLDRIKSNSKYAQEFLLDFLDKIIEIGEYNAEVMRIIGEFLSGTIDMEEFSYKLFNAGKVGYDEFDDISDESLIRHDNIKRGLHDYIYPFSTAQFYHPISDESIFEKMIRTIFEFTRDDEPYLRGVCYDYCLFLCALDIMKNGSTKYTMRCGIERGRGVNWFMHDGSKVVDPFNGIYTDDKKYKISCVREIITPFGDNLIKKAIIAHENSTLSSSIR